MTPSDYLRVAVDPTRLAILGAAAIGPLDVARLSEELGKPRSKIIKEVEKLRQMSLLTESDELAVEVLRGLAKRLPSDPKHDLSIVEGPWTEEEKQVLSRFFEGVRLVALPSSDRKRRVVLERLALEFEPGLRYSERQVNSILQLYNEDYATMRRYLVDYGMLTRADGVYWRSGGRMELDQPADR